MKKVISLILVLLMIVSMLPMAAMAEESAEKSWASYKYLMKDKDGKYFGRNSETAEWEPLSEAASKDYEAHLAAQGKKIVHEPDEHSYGWAWDLKYHWLQCACGCKISMEPHVDPLDTEDDYCFCGKHFSSNASLVTLWIQGTYGIKNFNKNVTEYTIKGHTYKDFKDVRIATRTANCGATVELPENRDINEGENVFEIKVTAENKKVTKTYTVTVVKDSK